ncbi:Tetraspanin-9 [Labeo rohita]|uniref:Tetraspanin-9 n=1 Tax=Labeo rohita TaxID=84645 RepID=A0ABQ8LTZ2_LABRO|nr:Tetraspanin-9 [Labeo rohita]
MKILVDYYPPRARRGLVSSLMKLRVSPNRCFSLLFKGTSQMYGRMLGGVESRQGFLGGSLFTPFAMLSVEAKGCEHVSFISLPHELGGRGTAVTQNLQLGLHRMAKQQAFLNAHIVLTHLHKPKPPGQKYDKPVQTCPHSGDSNTHRRDLKKSTRLPHYITIHSHFHSQFNPRIVSENAKQDLKDGLALYNTDNNIGLRNAWNIIQAEWKCCGVTGYTDWHEALKEKVVPDRCCQEHYQECGRNSTNMFWTRGCYEKVEEWLEDNKHLLGTIGMCILVVQLLGMAFSMTLFHQIHRSGKKYDA